MAFQDPKRSRPNPDAPECEQAIQYKVYITDFEDATHEHRHEKGLAMEGEVDPAGAKALFANLKAGIENTSGSAGGGNVPRMTPEQVRDEKARKEKAKQDRIEKQAKQPAHEKGKLWVVAIGKEITICKSTRAEVATPRLFASRKLSKPKEPDTTPWGPPNANMNSLNLALGHQQVSGAH